MIMQKKFRAVTVTMKVRACNDAGRDITSTYLERKVEDAIAPVIAAFMANPDCSGIASLKIDIDAAGITKPTAADRHKDYAETQKL